MKLEPFGDFLQGRFEGGTRLFVHPTRKFKTLTLRQTMTERLDDQASWRALVPSVLRRGSRGHPTMIELSRKLETFFGASLGYDVFKLGERQGLSWSLELLNESNLPETSGLFARGVSLLGEVMFDPVLENGGFRPAYVEQERLNLVRQIESLINDKMSYSTMRLLQEMFSGEPYAIYEWGRTDDLAVVDPVELYRFYRNMVASTPSDIYLVGDVDAEAVASRVVDLARHHAPAPRTPAAATSTTRTRTLRTLIEHDEVSQAKLVIGCRVDMTDVDDRTFSSFALFNCLLGGGMHSRLFKEVRERQSLAYYAASSLDRLKGALFISCGIDSDKFERARDISLAQIDVIAREEFTDDELEASRRTLIHRLRGTSDSAHGMIDFLQGYAAAGRVMTLAEVIEWMQRLGAKDVAGIARRITPDTIYLLKEME